MLDDDNAKDNKYFFRFSDGFTSWTRPPLALGRLCYPSPVLGGITNLNLISLSLSNILQKSFSLSSYNINHKALSLSNIKLRSLSLSSCSPQCSPGSPSPPPCSVCPCSSSPPASVGTRPTATNQAAPTTNQDRPTTNRELFILAGCSPQRQPHTHSPWRLR